MRSACHSYKLKAHELGFQLVRCLWPASFSILHSTQFFKLRCGENCAKVKSDEGCRPKNFTKPCVEGGGKRQLPSTIPQYFVFLCELYLAWGPGNTHTQGVFPRVPPRVSPQQKLLYWTRGGTRGRHPHTNTLTHSHT